MLTTLRGRYPRAFQLVAFVTALSLFIWSSAPAFALTTAGTVISHPKTTATGVTSGGNTISAESNAPAPVTVWDVYGAQWAATATGSVVAPGSSAMYRYVFRNTGNVGVSSASSTFYYSAAGNSWIAGIYLDAAGTQAATGSVKLPPNTGNEFTIYVKVAPPAGTGVTTATTTVTVQNQYYQAKSANDKFGNPDRITHSIATTTTDNIAPALAVSGPAAGVKLTTSGPNVTGTTEAGATVQIAIATSTYSVTADAGGNFSKTVALSQGSNTITVTAKDAANNVSAPIARSVSVDSIMPTAVITSPAQNTWMTGSAVIQGTANDANFTEYSLLYGPGESPTAWGTVTATTTIAVNSGTLGTWDTSRLYGPYTLRLTVKDSYGQTSTLNWRVNAGNSDALSGLLVKGQWTMLALPGVPQDVDPTKFLGGSRYEIQRWDPTDTTPDAYLLNYKRSGEFVIDGAGFGFWVKPYEYDIAWTAPAWIPDTTEQYSQKVYTGWNQLGAPYNRDKYGTPVPDIKWDNFQMKRTSTGEVKTMAQAIAAGWINGSYYAYRNGGYVELGAGASFEPYEGYFVRAYVDGELLLDPGAGMPSGVARIVRPQYEWNLRIEAESASGRDSDNYAAMVRGAEEEFDPMDSGEPPIVRPYVTVYFPHDGWSRNAGRYARDTRSAEMAAPEEGRAPEKEWRFVVETSEAGEKITLRTPDADKLPTNYDVTIRDTVTGTEFDPRKTAEYSFVDSGVPREFTLKAKKLGMLPEVEVPVDMPAGWSMISVPLEPEDTDVRAQLGDDLAKITVFQYYDREMYDPDSKEKVDLQAGIGYWMYLEAAQRVDFKGVRTDPSKPVAVPLVVGWNLIGNPYEADITFGDNVTVKYGGEEIALSEAVRRGLIAVPIYTYLNPEARYEEVGQGGALKAWRGYAIKALAACEIVLKP